MRSTEGGNWGRIYADNSRDTASEASPGSGAGLKSPGAQRWQEATGDVGGGDTTYKHVLFGARPEQQYGAQRPQLRHELLARVVDDGGASPRRAQHDGKRPAARRQPVVVLALQQAREQRRDVRVRLAAARRRHRHHVEAAPDGGPRDRLDVARPPQAKVVQRLATGNGKIITGSGFFSPTQTQQ